MISEFQKNLDYEYNNIELLKNALTHSSYSNEHHCDFGSNERLEFLGDAVLSIVVSDYIYKNYSKLPEGKLTKLRASLVCEKTLCEFSRKLKVGKYLYLSHGEDHNGGRERDSILADAFEAILASMYLDGGIEVASRFVLNFIIPEISKIENKTDFDYKTRLQEVIQQNPEERLVYNLVSESGPDHNKHFIVEVLINNNIVGTGEGSSKKEAQQFAAKEALTLMGIL